MIKTRTLPRLRLSCLTLSVCFSIVPSCAAQSDWRLIWGDEFNGPRNAAPDPSKWTYDLGGGGWGNNELEVYTDRRENSYQDGHGNLVIRVLKTRSGGYTSARLKTSK